jgi:hypothetical protein
VSRCHSIKQSHCRWWCRYSGCHWHWPRG